MLKIRKCIIWGIGNGYEELINQLLFEKCKGNISIEALVCRKQDKYCSARDSFPVITKDELKIGTFDYIIITAYTKFKEIRNEALELGVCSKQIIDGSKMRLPFFDFKKYAELIENPVTILSDDCWGGYVYHSLGLPFSTPLINIYIKGDEYAKFVLDPLFYLNTDLTMITEGNLREGIYPVGQLGDSDKSIKLELLHNVNFEDAKKQWDRRRKRINPNNMFLKMGFDIAEKKKYFYINSFNNSPVQNKILFYLGNEKVDGVFKTERFIWRGGGENRVDTFSFSDYMKGNYWLELDVFKLLTGDKDYSRY